MNLVKPLSLPTILPHPDAIKSHEDNKHGYDPEFWEFQYDVYRYLGGLPDDALILRYLSILRNMQALIRRERHVIPIGMFLSSWYWYRKEHQTRYEFALRKIDLPCELPNLFEDASVVAPARPRFPNGTDVLFRYSKLEHLLSMVKFGIVRLSPAHCYKGLEEDWARTDDELNKHSFLPRAYSKIKTADGQDIPLRGDIKRTVSAPDYFVLCASCDWDTSLFQSFPEADACALIRNPQELAMRLKAASKSNLADWYFHDGPVLYFDPYENPFTGRVFDAATCKDFRFAYQQEYRFIWISGKQHALEPIFLDVGPLEDITEIYLQGGTRTL